MTFSSLWGPLAYSPGQNTGMGSFSRGSFQPRDRTQVSRIAGGFFTRWATREAQEYWSGQHVSSPGDLPNPGTELGSPALQADSLSELSNSPQSCIEPGSSSPLVEFPYNGFFFSGSLKTKTKQKSFAPYFLWFFFQGLSHPVEISA